MAFADFDLKTACERFGLTIEERTNLFAAVQAVEVPALARSAGDVGAGGAGHEYGESAFGDDHRSDLDGSGPHARRACSACSPASPSTWTGTSD